MIFHGCHFDMDATKKTLYMHHYNIQSRITTHPSITRCSYLIQFVGQLLIPLKDNLHLLQRIRDLFCCTRRSAAGSHTGAHPACRPYDRRSDNQSHAQKQHASTKHSGPKSQPRLFSEFAKAPQAATQTHPAGRP
jgi:hypothetical protein